MDQLDMFSAAPAPRRSLRSGGDGGGKRPAPKSQTIAQRFAAFDKAHPEVFRELVTLATRDLSAGVKRIGVKALWERLRGRLATMADGGCSLNNDFTSLYARKLAALDKRFAAVIELRERRAK